MDYEDEELDYEEDMHIDENALDIEWTEQGELTLKYGRNWSNCKKRLTQAEERIKVIRAELIAEANSNPKKCCHKDKPNVADIEAYYRNHIRHKKAKERWVEAQFELNMAEVAKNEISFTRKAALENLVFLYGQSYFAGPRIPRNLSAEKLKKAKEKRSNAGVASKLTRNK